MFAYQSGGEVLAGDHILYHGEPGEVEFVIARRVGEPAIDWHLRDYPDGGMMIRTSESGRVFLVNTDEDLVFLSRRAQSAK